jgi:hypothetical protein
MYHLGRPTAGPRVCGRRVDVSEKIAVEIAVVGRPFERQGESIIPQVGLFPTP